MALAMLALSDRDGAIAMDVEYVDGFDKTSHAHQHMQLLVKAMDGLAARIPEQEPQAGEISQAAATSAILDARGRPMLVDGEEV